MCTRTVKHWKWCTWHRKASAKTQVSLTKFLQSEVKIIHIIVQNNTYNLFGHVNILIDFLFPYLSKFCQPLASSVMTISGCHALVVFSHTFWWNYCHWGHQNLKFCVCFCDENSPGNLSSFSNFPPFCINGFLYTHVMLVLIYPCAGISCFENVLYLVFTFLMVCLMVGLEVLWSSQDPRFASSNPADVYGFLRM